MLQSIHIDRLLTNVAQSIDRRLTAERGRDETVDADVIVVRASWGRSLRYLYDKNRTDGDDLAAVREMATEVLGHAPLGEYDGTCSYD